MNLPNTEDVKTADEARELAIDWQHETSDTDLYMSEVMEYADYFSVLANKFNLTDEFRENGII